MCGCPLATPEQFPSDSLAVEVFKMDNCDYYIICNFHDHTTTN